MADVRVTPSDHDQRARIAEITTAFEQFTAECNGLRTSTGLAAAETALEAANASRKAIVDKIIAAKATTLAGLQVRAMIVRDIYEGDLSGEDDGETTDRRLIWATLRDLATPSSS